MGRHSDPAQQMKLAGAEGFEPPSPVLETSSLTVELTPLKMQESGISRRYADPCSLISSP